MTPEEILAECKDLNEIGEAAGNEVEHQLIKLQNNIGKLFLQAATLLAQSRKEARELRQEVEHLKGQLKYFTGGPIE